MSHDLSWTNHISLITDGDDRKLGLLRRTFCSTNSISAKKSLHLSLVRSQLVYCSQIWSPYQAKDIKLLEDVQRRATKFILSDFTSDYKTRLVKLHLLPLSMLFEVNDLCFFVKSVKQPTSSFNILNHVSFSCNNTRSRTHVKLVQPLVSDNRQKHIYFNRIARLWNSLYCLLMYISIVPTIKSVFWEQFNLTFESSNSCTYHLCSPCNKCQALTRSSFQVHQ